MSEKGLDVVWVYAGRWKTLEKEAEEKAYCVKQVGCACVERCRRESLGTSRGEEVYWWEKR
ncbi:hypothetical protein [Bartonella bovis]|uniref:hypothetical protein n=1 Tax=Bartonella bovis TaxID=155194 RepID=UPI0003B3A6EC|nr:hypothetical protein [Bartonella bovis]